MASEILFRAAALILRLFLGCSGSKRNVVFDPAQVSYKEYEAKLAVAVLELYDVTSRLNEAGLTRDLQALVAAIDAERTS